ncbi:MAG: hypothetical protein H7Y01_09400 [Ferruginibacter sp.]|nr:hypothetical protein [Chitinophagaceae bacterium]
MMEKFNEATTNRPEGDRAVDLPFLFLDIPSLLMQLKNEEAWQKNDRNAITIFKTTGMRIVLVALHANAEMQTHTTQGHLSLQVLEGRMKFTTPGDSVEIKKGQAVTLHGGVAHSVLAIDETTFLLTIAQ